MNQIEQSQIVLNEIFSALNLPIVVLQQPMKEGDTALRFMRVTENDEETQLKDFDSARPLANKLHDALRHIGLDEYGPGKNKTYAQAIQKIGKSQIVLTFMKEARVLEHGGDLTLLVNPNAAFWAQNRGALTKALAAQFAVK